jgi:hypothetical protein
MLSSTPNDSCIALDLHIPSSHFRRQRLCGIVEQAHATGERVEMLLGQRSQLEEMAVERFA